LLGNCLCNDAVVAERSKICQYSGGCFGFGATVARIFRPQHGNSAENFSPQGWERLLRSHGLIWVSGTVPGGIHDRILEGIVGDETGGGTLMHIMDPDGGRRYTETLSTFIVGFEGQAAVEPFHSDYQVLHF
jgi:hypothetical protein